MINFKKFSYETKNYIFKDLIRDLYKISDLEKIHILKSELLPKEELNFNNEASTAFHELFYKKLNNNWLEFIEAYKKFINNEIGKLIKNLFYINICHHTEYNCQMIKRYISGILIVTRIINIQMEK